MAGIISQAQGAPRQSAPDGQEVAQNEPVKPQNGELDSKQAYDIAAGQMLNFVYDEAGTQALMSMAQAGSDPGQAMARLIARLLVTTEQSARMSGQKIPPDAMFAAGMEVAAALSEVAQSNGLLDASNEAEVTESAFFDAIALFGQEAAEEALTDNDRQAYLAMIDQLEAMAGQAGQSAPQDQQAPQQQPQGGRA